MERRSFITGLAAALIFGVDTEAEAKKRKRRKARRRAGFSSYTGHRGVANDGKCPCNGGDVCIGPRGGRYCITRGGNKRYGV
jgi:hypothetical protein